jgi:hypothetical protein
MPHCHRMPVFFALLVILAPGSHAFSQTPTQQSPWPRPRRNVTQWILDSRDSVTAAARLKPLAVTRLGTGEQEIRIWIGEGIGVPENLYRIVRRNGLATGELIYFWDLGPRGGAESGEPDFNAVLLYSLEGQCGSVGRAGNAYACHTNLIRSPDWQAILRRMERAALWTLPDESELPPDSILVMDGWGVLVEVRDGLNYRAYHHSNPDAHGNMFSQQAVQIAAALDPVDSLLAPAENRKRYRGLLRLGSTRSEFTPCGETKPWTFQGGLSYHNELQKSGLDSLSYPTISRYVEARGLREYPGLSRFYTQYDDGIHLDTVYVNRPWDPKECQ